DPDLTVLVSPVDTVAIANQGTIRVGDLELRIRQRDGGVDRTNLPDEQDTIRHILKPDSDDTLLAAVRQVDRLRGLDDTVPICWIHLFQNIVARLQPGPDGGAVLAGDFLANHGTASARGAAEEPQLERGPG